MTPETNQGFSCCKIDVTNVMIENDRNTMQSVYAIKKINQTIMQGEYYWNNNEINSCTR